MRSSCRYPSTPLCGGLYGALAVAFCASAGWAAPDIGFGSIEGLGVVAREGTYPDGASALSMMTTACNVGAENISWLAPMSEDHPAVVMQLYRMSDGRFEQVGISAARHEYFALSNSECGTCQVQSNGTFLGAGCSTTSGVGINADRNLLGPRGEIDPYSGAWTCSGSLFAGGQSDCVARPHDGDGPLDRRLVVTDADLDVPGASFVYEAYWVTAGDADRRNSVGSRSANVIRVGSNFIVSDVNDEAVGAALERWGGTQTWVSLPGDGELLLASKSWDLGGGLYQYEYALFNLDSARKVGAVRIPVGSSTVSDIGFHDPDSDPATDWVSGVSGGEISWSTDSFDVDPEAPALSYGLLYNFRFVSDQPPAEGTATLVAFEGGEDEVAVAAVVPEGSTTSVSEFATESTFGLTCRPMPMQASGEISFRLENSASVSLAVFDASGRLLRALHEGTAPAGENVVRWDGTDASGRSVAPGVYFVRLRGVQGEETARISVVR
ncbi:MAG: T9SS type A sorting domain-containing protein [Candidatus Eisenbacteria bacterium]|uniref:T9SS type A sorting domain-containing protein n=1 Tax=Eiseniibacteriota bacterium TaxID=2212470 RepID=A0A956SDI7_UNCEI|nr:T9SS type A sorting domain-containing protein [Candidatus Eisenbacteria bacterium]MCB9462088.1 T9SS type A sorting domain-containing protein [Candidatus Eisenbacteria bacterium]